MKNYRLHFIRHGMTDSNKRGAYAGRRTDAELSVEGIRGLLRLKEDAILLNGGRGSVVDCAALAEVLESGRLWGAGLDVTDPEPLPPEHPLWRQPRALITPHAAGGDHLPDTARRIAAIALDNLGRYLRGEPLRNRVG